MKTIKPVGKYKGEILVDDDDYERFGEMRWRTLEMGFHKKRYYAMVSSPTRYLHRLIMDAKKGQIVDHIDGNSLNNQRYNLRFCSAYENQWNAPGWTNRLSKYKGVYKSGNCWRVDLSCENKRIYIGHYKDEIDAVKAYNEAVKKYHGEFAVINLVSQEK